MVETFNSKKKIELSPGEWYFAASNEETLTDEAGQSKFYSTIEAFP